MSDDDDHPMPENFCEAFRWAVRKTSDWLRYGGEEPEVYLEHKPYTVSALFTLMSKFEKDMPPHVLGEVLGVIGGAREDQRDDLEGDPSYGNAAKHLSQRIGERKEELARRDAHRGT